MRPFVYMHDDPEPALPINGHTSIDILHKQEFGPGDIVRINNEADLYMVEVTLPGIDGFVYAVLTYGENDGEMVICPVSKLKLVARAE